MRKEIEFNGKKIILVGTAHISQESINEVKQAIQEHVPDTVCVELCKTRYESIQQKDRWKNMDIFKVVKEGRAPLLMGNLILSAFQKKIGDQLGIQPGAEMVQAVSLAKETGAEILLADREVSITLKRTWRKLSFWEKIKLLSEILGKMFASSDIDKEEIEKLKQSDVLTSMIEEMGKQFPVVKEVVIDERDQYLAHKIANTRGNTIVAVVGAGHCPGIEKHLGAKTNIKDLEVVPETKKWGYILTWVLPVLVIGVIVIAFFQFDADVSIEMIKGWVLVNGILSAIGAIIAGAHLVTVIVAFIAAPITSLNPTIAAGWVAGLTEAWIRKPKVSDFENLATDIISFSGFRRNEITKILLVVVLCNLGSMIGTFVGVSWVFSLF